MARSTKSFNQTADRLARNPLGLIALFIVLVYGMAALVLGLSGARLAAEDRRVLVWFLVLFPVAVLLAFYRLVATHHTKLYAPRDFHDPAGFFRALTPKEQKERLEREVRELEPTPGKVKEQALAGVTVETTRSFRPPLRQAVVLAEELAFRELEREFQVPVSRQVAFVGPDTGIDGAFVRQGRVTVVEVKLTRPDRFLPAVERVAAQIGKLTQETDASAYVAAIVIDGLQSLQPDQIAKAHGILKGISASTQLRLYDFDELKLRYGIDVSSYSGG